MKDSINFGTTKVSSLFRKLLMPTLLGMVSSALFVITDGIFVGRGLGSDALAAVNIVAPLFLINTGLGLMFGVGASVVASIHLSHGKPKTARINVTQAAIALSLVVLTFSMISVFWAADVARMLGSSERLLTPAVEYIYGAVPFFVFSSMLSAGMFYIRLDGSPRYAMMCNVVPALLNLIFDYLFIFVFGWGVIGAGIATSLGYIAGAGMVLWYMFFMGRTIKFCRVKTHLRSLRMTARNVGYICRLGFPSLLCEAAIAMMMFAGNYVFIAYLGEDGVAAYSIACYIFPIIFMVYNAIAQSAQPILSYNYGARLSQRVRSAFRLALSTALGSAVVFYLVTLLFAADIISLFIPAGFAANTIAVSGMPLFALGFVPFAVNIVAIGYYQSVERDSSAMFITVMRGYVLMLLCFWLMPKLAGVNGIWLAVPVAELLTCVLILVMYLKNRKGFATFVANNNVITAGSEAVNSK